MNNYFQNEGEIEDLFRCMADSSPILMWVSDNTGLCTFFNKPWLEFRGRTLEQEIGNGWFEGVHQEDYEYCLNTYLEAFSEYKGFSMEYRLLRFDGEYRWILDKGSPYFSSKGDFKGYIGSCLDITERKQAEQIINKQNRRLEDFFENAPVCIHWLDPEGYIIKVNKTQCELFGYSAEDYIGKQMSQFYLDQNKAVNNLQTVLAGGEILNQEIQLFTIDSSIKYLLLSSKAYYEDGELKYIHNFMRDITFRKQAERQLLKVHTDLEERTKELAKVNEVLKEEIVHKEVLTNKLQEETKTLESLNNLGCILLAELDLNKLVQVITDAATDLTGSEFGAFFYNHSVEEGKFVTVQVVSGKYKDLIPEFPVPRNGFLIYPSQFAVRIADIQKDSADLKKLPYYGILKSHLSIRSYMSVPVISRSGEILGALFFTHPKAGAFTEREEKLVYNLAAQAAIAIDNAKLFETVRIERSKAQANEQYYRFLAEAIPQIVWTAGPDGKTDYVNQKWVNYTGLRLEDTRNRDWKFILHPDDKQKSLERWRKSVSQGIPYEDEFRFKRASDNSYRWHLGRALPLKDPNGNIIKWFGTSTDIDDQKKAEEQIRQSEAKFRSLVSSNIIGVFVCDEEGFIKEANEAFLKMLNYTQEDILYKKLNWKDITPSDYTELDDAMNAVLVNEGVLPPFEKEYFAKNGKRVPVVAGATLIEGHEKLAVAFVLDISQQKELEKRKDEFISMASHELKTPITSTKVFIQMLIKMLEHKTNLDEKPLVFLSKIDEQIDKLSKLIADLLNISKIQSGKLEFCKEWFDLDNFIFEVVENYQLSSSKHKIEIIGKIEKQVYADKNRLEQVLINLLSNAIKYSPQAHKVIVELMFLPESEIIVNVRDFGIGIDKDHQDKIFNRFYRVFEENEKTFPGLGIGLYISAEIIKYHEGKIWVHSLKGQGSVFSFSLPIYSDIMNSPMEEIKHESQNFASRR